MKNKTILFMNILIMLSFISVVTESTAKEIKLKAAGAFRSNIFTNYILYDEENTSVQFCLPNYLKRKVFERIPQGNELNLLVSSDKCTVNEDIAIHSMNCTFDGLVNVGIKVDDLENITTEFRPLLPGETDMIYSKEDFGIVKTKIEKCQTVQAFGKSRIANDKYNYIHYDSDAKFVEVCAYPTIDALKPIKTRWMCNPVMVDGNETQMNCNKNTKFYAHVSHSGSILQKTNDIYTDYPQLVSKDEAMVGLSQCQ